MATIINNPGDSADNSAGWAVSVIILLVVIVGGIFWYTRYHRAAPSQGATIQVNLPTGGSNTGGSGGGTTPAPNQ